MNFCNRRFLTCGRTTKKANNCLQRQNKMQYKSYPCRQSWKSL